MKGLVRWFIDNPIAANLVMVLVLIGGFSTIPQLDKEFFPQRKLNQITISVAYPGANPSEVEKQVILRIEEAINDVDGIDEIRSTASDGSGLITLDVASGQDSQRLLNDIKTRVEGVSTLPAESERPLVSERLWRDRVVSLALFGDLPEAELKALGESIREDLAALPSVSVVELRTPRNDELAIEVSEIALRERGLRFEDVVQAVRNASVNLPGGKVRTDNGDIQIQTRGQAYTAQDFENIVLLSQLDGSLVRIGDVAKVIDGFEESNVIGRFDGKSSYAIDTYVTSSPNLLTTSAEVRDYVASMQSKLPEGAELTIWRDMSISYLDRVSTLINNGLGGLVLVFILLLLFLRPLLAVWVCVGIAVAFLGAVWLMPVLGTSLNMVSLFAFILILGIVVDDAIIVGEAIYTEQAKGGTSHAGAVNGALSVMKPVCFAVISTMLFFMPFYFLPEEAAEPPNLADVVMLALAFSLFESLFILPAHLAHMAPEKPGRLPVLRQLEIWREKFSHGMEKLIAQHYLPILRKCIDWRGLTLTTFAMVFIVVISFLFGGWVKSSFFPRVPGNYIVANITMQEGVPFSEVEATMQHIADAASLLQKELNSEDDIPYAGSIEMAAYNSAIRVTLELLNIEERNVPVALIRNRWQNAVGQIDNAKNIDFSFTIIPLGKGIELQVVSRDLNELRAASAELKEELSRYPGVFNVSDSLENPLPEIEIRLKPLAETLDISLGDIARQVRRGFYGEEAQRIPRLREDVRVMVRYPRDERESIHNIRNMRIRTNDGREIPFEAIAELHLVEGYSKIERVDRKRVALVSAEIQAGYSASTTIASLLQGKTLDWAVRYPSTTVQKEGEQARQSEFMTRVVQLMILSMILIYGLMAIVFHSYWQPILILTAVPFGFMGGLMGHLILNQELAMFSVLGMIACAGVVVNDNLVLVDRINQLRNKGSSAIDAVVGGVRDRFRPIILTSLTTFIGLTPIMLESSIQAQFLKPMVVSLAFGVLVATTVTLLFVPCLYLLGDSVQTRLSARLAALKQAALKRVGVD